ncbi:MAG: hypothetical protein ACTHNW_20700 [Mucilaginibacter sp.]
MKYLFLLLPFSLLMLSGFYYAKYNRIKDTGKIPVIVAAKRNTTLCLLLALTIVFMFFVVLGYEA